MEKHGVTPDELLPETKEEQQQKEAAAGTGCGDDTVSRLADAAKAQSKEKDERA
jgi:hypothetical protein